MTTFDLAKLRLSLPVGRAIGRAAPQQRDHRFLKGPIPWNWISEAAKQPGHALHVAIALWFRAGITRSETVTLTTTLVAELGVDRHAKYRALKELEQAGLVRVTRRHGKNPEVTLCSPGRAVVSCPE